MDDWGKCSERRIAFVDCEASSLDERHSYPIEVGWCFADTGEVEAHLIVPHPDWLDWDPGSQEVHGISRRLLFEQGEPGPHVVRRLLDALRGADVYADSPLDQIWIARLCNAAGFAEAPSLGSFEQLLNAATRHLPYSSRLKVILEARWAADAGRPRAHRAGPDAAHLCAWYRALRAGKRDR